MDSFFDILIPCCAVTIEQEDRIQTGMEQMSGNRKPSALGGSCTQPEVLIYCIYSAETIPCTKSCTRGLNNIEASLTSFRGGTGADNPRTVTHFLLVIFCFGSQELKYVYNVLGECMLYTFN